MVDALSYPTQGSHRLSDDWDDHIRRGSMGGVDFPVAYGTPVYATHDGFLSVDPSSAGSGGRVATIQGGGITDQILHMSSFARGNGTVARGELVGYSGASAYGSDYGTGGPHVHWHAIVNGTRVNPLNYLSATAGNNATNLQEEDDMFSDTDRAELRILLQSQKEIQLNTWQANQWLKNDGPASIMGKLDLCLYLLQGNKPTDGSVKNLLTEVEKDVQKLLDAHDK